LQVTVIVITVAPLLAVFLVTNNSSSINSLLTLHLVPYLS
jgi:hypothetical protein